MEIKTISATDLKAKLDKEEKFKLVEVLPHELFSKDHLPHAINIPINEIEERAPKELDKEEEIVVYCFDTACQASPNAAKKLMEMGYQKVVDFEAGKEGWKEAGFKLEQ